MKKFFFLFFLCLFSADCMLAQQKDSIQSSKLYTSHHPAYSLTTPMPTFIIDGIIIHSELNGKIPKQVAELNPNEIVKMEVIKSDMAMALYGDDSKNGVVKITTRKK